MAESKLNLGKDLGKGFGKIKTEKKHKNYLFPIFLILAGLYFLLKDKVGFLNNNDVYNWVAIALIVVGVIAFLAKMFSRS